MGRTMQMKDRMSLPRTVFLHPPTRIRRYYAYSPPFRNESRSPSRPMQAIVDALSLMA